jgi:hypothetical protein
VQKLRIATITMQFAMQIGDFYDEHKAQQKKEEERNLRKQMRR